MGAHQDVRTTDEIICDMLADDYSFDEIAARLRMAVEYIESRFKVICARLGPQAK